MDRERVKNQSGLAIMVSNLRVTGDPHREYVSVPCDGLIDENNGLLDVLKLVRVGGGCPSFSARWDQGPDDLDIDIHHPSKDVVAAFKGGKDGYSGHTKKTNRRPEQPNVQDNHQDAERFVF